MTADGPFAGRTVLVTGGARGVGGSISTEFARRGAHVVVNFFHSPDAAWRLVDELTREGLSAEAVKASVAKADQVEEMFAQVRERHGGLDVLVNNAARGVFLPLAQLEEADWQRALDLNFHGVRHCSLAALPLLASRPGSSVVNVSSHGASQVVSDYGQVGSTKAAMEALSRYLAVEFAPHGVRVNVAACQVMDNRVGDMFPRAEEMKATTRAATPWGRLPTEEDLARLVVLLALPEAGFVTGQTVLADGGLALGAALHAPLVHRPTAVEPTAAEPTAEPTAGQARTTEPTASTRPAGARQATRPGPVLAPRTDRSSPDERPLVALVGTGLLVPEASSPEEFWQLLQGDTPVFRSPAERYRLEDFHNADPAAVDKAYTTQAGVISAPRLHPRATELPGSAEVEQWLRHVVAQATEGVTVPGGRVSLLCGGWPDGSMEMEEGALRDLLATAAARDGVDPETVRGLLRDHLPHLAGPAGDYLPDRMLRRALGGLLPQDTEILGLDVACASGLYAIDLAARRLLDHRADLAVAAGLSLCTVRYLILFSKVTGLSRSGDVRAFDEAADGTLFADSAAAVALKRLDDAERDGDEILGVLTGFGASSDGKGKAVYAPSAKGQRLALGNAYGTGADARPPAPWVVAHATGTPAGDRVELTALAETAADTDTHVTVSGNKSLVGHGGWTSGLTSVIHAALGLRHGVAPAQPRYRAPLPGGLPDRVAVPTEPLPLAHPDGGDRGDGGNGGGPRRAGVSAFGFGGINAHTVLADRASAGERSAAAPRGGPLVLVGWSARLPGTDGSAGALARLHRGGLPRAGEQGYGARYPVPPLTEVRLPPRTAKAVDRTQLMAIQALGALAAEHGTLWSEVADRTVVIGAHSGPTRLSQEISVRCFDVPLERALGGHAATQAWWSGYRQTLRDAVPPVTEDTLPGLLPNLIVGRLANYFDLHGPTLNVDVGRRSGRHAVAVAEDYLRGGIGELALVVGSQGNTLPGSGALFGVPDEALAEGLFVAGLALRSTAEEQGWPVLATLPDSIAWPEHGDADEARSGRPTVSFGGADDVAALLTMLLPDRDGASRGAEPAAVPGVGTWNDTGKEDSADDTAGDAGTAAPRWFRSELTPDPGTPTEPALPGLPALPDGCLVVTDDADLAAVWPRPSGPSGARSPAPTRRRPESPASWCSPTSTGTPSCASSRTPGTRPTCGSSATRPEPSGPRRRTDA